MDLSELLDAPTANEGQIVVVISEQETVFGGVIITNPPDSPVVIDLAAIGGNGSETPTVETSVTSQEMALADALLSDRITSVGVGAGVSVTSAKVATASAAATSADLHANTVSARVVSVSAELASLINVTSADLVSQVQVASAAASVANSHANTVSARVVSVSAELVSLLNSAGAALSTRIDAANVNSAQVNAISARVVSVSAEVVSLMASIEARLSTRIDLGGGTASVTSAQVQAVSALAHTSISVLSSRVTSVSNEVVSLMGVADAALSVRIDNAAHGYSTTSTSIADTMVLGAASPYEEFYTGQGDTVQMPDVTTLVLGKQYLIKNNTSGGLNVVSSGNNPIVVIDVGLAAILTCIKITGTDATSWDYIYIPDNDAVFSMDTALSLRITSVGGLAGASVTSAKLASVDAHANTVSARAVSVSAELASLLASTSAQLRADITSVAGLAGGGSVTSAEAASIDAHANTVSARVVSVSAELVSLMNSADAALSLRVTSVGGLAGGGSVTSAELNVVSARLVSVSAEVVSLMNSIEARLSGRIDLGGGTASVTSAELASVDAHANTVSARVVSVSAELVSLIQGYSTIATAAGTTFLSAGSPPEEFFTGITTQTVRLPDPATLVAGKQYLVKNKSTGLVFAQDFSGTPLVNILSEQAVIFTFIGGSSWDYITAGNAATDVVSARVVSVSAELASLVASLSANLISKIGVVSLSANAISARVVSVSAEVVSLMNSADAALSTRINTASALGTTADTHANTVSARAVSISAELASLLASASAALETHAAAASAAANAVSVRAVSISNELGSLLASTSAQLRSDLTSVDNKFSVGLNLQSVALNAQSAKIVSVEAHVDTVSARAVSVSAELASLLASTSAQLRADITSVAGLAGGGSATSAEIYSIVQGYSTFAASTVSVLLSAGSPPEEFITGTAAQPILMPDVTTLVLGKQYLIKNNSTASATVASSGGNAIVTIPAGGAAVLTCILITGTTAASWDYTMAGSVAVDAVSARVVSVSAELASLVNIVSARAVSVSAELVSLMNSADAALSARVTSVGGLGGASVTSAEFDALSAHVDTTLSISVHKISTNLDAETSQRLAADASLETHINTVSIAANTVSARVVSVSAELASLLVSAVPLKAVNTANQASITVSTGLTISGVSVIVSAGQTYAFEFQIPFTAAVATGLMVAVVGPATTNYACNYQIPGAVGTTGVAPAANAVTPFMAQVRAIGTKVSTTSVTLTGTTLMAYAWGTIKPSATGSIKFVIGPNTSGGANSGIVPLLGCNVVATRLN